jgi:hypothetical protein
VPVFVLYLCAFNRLLDQIFPSLRLPLVPIIRARKVPVKMTVYLLCKFIITDQAHFCLDSREKDAGIRKIKQLKSCSRKSYDIKLTRLPNDYYAFFKTNAASSIMADKPFNN